MHGTDIPRWRLGLLVLAVCLAGACESEPESGRTGEESAEVATSAPHATDDSVISLGVVGNRFEYDQTEIEAYPREDLKIQLTNSADDESVKHNFVQLHTDRARTAMKVAKAGWKVPEKNYVPEHDAILAASSMAGPGETVDVSFTAPDQDGKYVYICTFPAHYPSMQGTLIVRD